MEVKSLRFEPNGLGFNSPADELNLIVPETGRSLILINRGEIMMVDPAENI